MIQEEHMFQVGGAKKSPTKDGDSDEFWGGDPKEDSSELPWFLQRLLL